MLPKFEFVPIPTCNPREGSGAGCTAPTLMLFMRGLNWTSWKKLAAAEFITGPVYWQELSKAAPSGWRHQNLQMVLETNVVMRTPKPPRILAVHYWQAGNHSSAQLVGLVAESTGLMATGPQWKGRTGAGFSR